MGRELPRHSDVTMTMRYTHIGLKDQAKVIVNLPTDPKGLETGRSAEPLSQHICSTSQHIFRKSRVSAGHLQSTEDTGCHSEAAKPADASDDEAPPSGTHRQKKAPPVTDGAQVEAAGIEPASRDISMQASTCVVGYLNFARCAPARQGNPMTSQERF